jgi:hypothetical protein
MIPVPNDKLEEKHIWREFFTGIFDRLTKKFILPKYTTAAAPPAEEGLMYFDITLQKTRVGVSDGGSPPTYSYETITSV